MAVNSLLSPWCPIIISPHGCVLCVILYPIHINPKWVLVFHYVRYKETSIRPGACSLFKAGKCANVSQIYWHCCTITRKWNNHMLHDFGHSQMLVQ